MDIIASPSTVIPLLLLLILIIYYLLSLTGALREANQDLKNQLRRERQEERRKMLQRVVNAKLDDSGGNDAISKWRKVLEASSPVTPNATGQTVEPDEEKMKARREFLARIMKKALRKSSNTSEDEGDGADDDTDADDQLPHDQDSEKRTPIKRKRSSIQLLDDRKADDSLDAQQDEKHHRHHHQTKQQQAHQHQHHHHQNHAVQPQPRKLSFMQLRDIVETSQQKPESKPIECKPTKHGATEHKDKVKSTKTSDSGKERAQAYAQSHSHTNEDEYNKAKVVSERRALRRQQNARESEGSLSLQCSLPDSTNYDIVNEKPMVMEKPKPIEKPPRNKSPQMNTSPEIFKFDSDVASIQLRDDTISGSRENDDSDYEQSSFKDTPTDSNKSKRPLFKEKSSSQSKNASPTTSIQLHSPMEREPNNSSNPPTPHECNDHRKDPSCLQSPSPSPPPPPPEQSPSPSSSDKIKQTDDILNKPIRKLNSFLALVKEAVQAKKQEQQHHSQLHPYQKSDLSADASPIVSRVKLFIDDSNSVSMTESTKTTTESMASSKNLTYFESIRRLRHAEPPKPNRQDSQTSLWSDNIPVITISKSESDECILEKDTDNDDVKVSHSTPNKHAK